MNWGFHIKNLREARRMTQPELAEMSGLTRSHIGNIERGVYKSYKPETLKKLAFGLGIPIKDLISEIFEIQEVEEKPEYLLERLRKSILARNILDIEDPDFELKSFLINDWNELDEEERDWIRRTISMVKENKKKPPLL